jgi:molecular chaperone IbpA
MAAPQIGSSKHLGPIGHDTWPSDIHRDPYSKVKEVAPRPVDPFVTITNAFLPWTVGFDRHINFLKELQEERITATYPPYNIIDLKNDKYQIQIACAGFTKSEIDIQFKENVITVTGSRNNRDEGSYLHKGIAARDFEQKFGVAEDVRILEASLNDGFLVIDLEREIPEHKKARTIDIK